jgi:hypothetical protein
MENIMKKVTYQRNNARVDINEVVLVSTNQVVGHFNALDDLPSNQYKQIEKNIMHLIATNQVKIIQRPAFDPEAEVNEDDFDLKLD